MKKKAWDEIRIIFAVLMTAAILAEMLAVGSFAAAAVREQKIYDTFSAYHSEP